jgi:hypothetical protein
MWSDATHDVPVKCKLIDGVLHLGCIWFDGLGGMKRDMTRSSYFFMVFLIERWLSTLTSVKKSEIS